MEREKRKRRDGSEGLLFKEVRLHKRGETGNKRLGELLLWQAIHSSSKELQKRRAEIGEWKSDDGEMSVAGGGGGGAGVYCGFVQQVLCYNKLSVKAVRSKATPVHPAHRICRMILCEGTCNTHNK